MLVVCVYLPRTNARILQSVAETCLAFTPQIALGDEAVFLEISASKNLFSPEECLLRLRQWLASQRHQARVALAGDIPTALAFARFPCQEKDDLPLAAITCYVSPFRALELPEFVPCKELGLNTIGDFRRLPLQELASRFGKEALLARERLLHAAHLPWPRLKFPEKILERADLDCAAQVENLEPILFIVKNILDRVLLRLFNRREKMLSFQLLFHFDPLAREKAPERKYFFRLPTPQCEAKSLLAIIQERLHQDLSVNPFPDAVAGMEIEVEESVPLLSSTKDFFSKTEESREAWGAVVGRIRERLGEGSAVQAAPSPRLLPEASWHAVSCATTEHSGTSVPTALRPLRFYHPPLPITRDGLELRSLQKRWRIQSIHGPERVEGEWWLGGFARDYFRVETGSEELWIYKNPSGGPFLQGVFD